MHEAEELDSSALGKPHRNGLRSMERTNRRRVKPEMATSWSEMYRRWPKITFCIITNEFCERFSYYGMRTVLTLYLANVLKYDDSHSTIFFNAFSALCYISPILGSIIADGYIGKFKTIFFVSILYASGQVLLAFSSTQFSDSKLHPWLDLAGLVIIAIGTGGIKPCVSPFGGDQFDSGETKMISLFFSVFYFSINAGSMISTFTAPIFRALPCLGQDSCYPLAFGIPAVLMILATIVFMLGSYWYKKKPPETNVFADVLHLCKRALGQKFRSNESKPHWLDHALDRHSCEHSPRCQTLKRRKRNPMACAEAKFIDDVKSLFRVLIMYLPLPMFWALYDQQGSVWNLQAIRMDSRLWGTTLMLPDQMQTLNAVLILIFIPLFETIIYPLTAKFFKITPLRKMIAGGLLASLAFVISGLVQMQVNRTLPSIPPDGRVYISMINTLPDCNVTLGEFGSNESNTITVGSHSSINATAGTAAQWLRAPRGYSVTFQLNTTGSGCPTVLPTRPILDIVDGRIFFFHLSSQGVFVQSVSEVKSTEGQGDHKIAVVAALSDTNYNKTFAVCRVDGKGATDEHPCDPKHKSDFYELSDGWKAEYTTADGNSGGKYAKIFESTSVRPGAWRLYYVEKSAETRDQIQVQYTGYEYTLHEQGGVYVISLTGEKAKPTVTIFLETPDNGISILWQIPQIVVITAAEILFSITGLEFSYTQAAPSMKSIVGAMFLLTTGIGDTCIVIFTLLFRNTDPVTVFFIYAALMFVVIVIFAFMAVFYYTYAFYDEPDEDEDNFSSSGESRDPKKAR